MILSFDIVIIGGGAAGLAAAAEAASRGRRVLLLEKSGKIGGTSALSVGSLMGASTRMQRAAGIVDSPDQHEAELKKIVAAAGVGDNPVLRRLLVENLGETVDLMEKLGVDFLGPLPQPPFTTSRFYQSLPAGRVIIRRLARYCRQLRVKIRTGASATRLIEDGGRVTGVVFTIGNEETSVEARDGVILASGDLSANRAWRGELWGKDLDALEPINPHVTGDGQRLGCSVGGQLVLRDDLVPHGVPRFRAPPTKPLAERVPPWRPVTWAMKALLGRFPTIMRPHVMRAALTALAPERSLYAAGAVLVNREGKRFVDELGPVGGAIARQTEGEAFVLLDGSVAERFSQWPDFVSTAPGIAYAYMDDYKRARRDLYTEGQTLGDLAEKFGCDPDTLEGSLRGRMADPKPPYVLLGPLKTWLLLTPAGLAVDTQLRVLNADNEPIAGLFAAGGAGQGGLSFTHYYHGHSLGWALTSGRLAGRAAAAA